MQKHAKFLESRFRCLSNKIFTRKLALSRNLLFTILWATFWNISLAGQATFDSAKKRRIFIGVRIESFKNAIYRFAILFAVRMQFFHSFVPRVPTMEKGRLSFCAIESRYVTGKTDARPEEWDLNMNEREGECAKKWPDVSSLVIKCTRCGLMTGFADCITGHFALFLKKKERKNTRFNSFTLFLAKSESLLTYLRIIAELGLIIEHVQVGVSMGLTVKISRSRSRCHGVRVPQSLQGFVSAR